MSKWIEVKALIPPGVLCANDEDRCSFLSTTDFMSDFCNRHSVTLEIEGFCNAFKCKACLEECARLEGASHNDI